MAQQTRAGTIFANDATVGTRDWTSPEKVASSNDDWASVALAKGIISHYLKVTGFGFTIPDNCAINWVKVSVERHADNILLHDYSVKLVKGGTIQGTDKATTTGWPASDTNEDHGGTDKWGLTLLYSDVNADNFGCVISAKNYKTGSDATYNGYIDYVIITIDYSPLTKKSLSIQMVNNVSLLQRTPPTLFAYYNTGHTVSVVIQSTDWSGQSFIPFIGHKIISVKLLLYRVNSPGTVIVSIRAIDSSGYPTGADLISGTIDGNLLPTSAQWCEIVFSSNIYLSPTVQYAIIVRAPNGDSSNYLCWRNDFTAPAYSYGNMFQSHDGGGTWGGVAEDNDFMFEDYGSLNGACVFAYPIDDVNLYPNSLEYGEPGFIKDSYGIWHASYYANYDVMHAWSSDEGLTWSREIIYTETAQYPSSLIAVDSNGTLYVIWVIITSPYYINKMSKKPHNGSWGTPTIVCAGTIDDPGSTCDALLVDSSNNLYFFYDGRYYKIYNGSSWSSKMLVSDDTYNWKYPVYFFDSSGQIHCFFEASNLRIKYTVYNGSWSTPVVVYDTGHEQSYPWAIMIGTTIYLCWEEKLGTNNNTIAFTYNNGSGWSSPVQLGGQIYKLLCVKFLYADSVFKFFYNGKKTSTEMTSLYYFESDGTNTAHFKAIVQNPVVDYVTYLAHILQTGIGSCVSFQYKNMIGQQWGQRYYFGKVVVYPEGETIIKKLLSIVMQNLLRFAKCKPIKRCMSFNQFMRNSMR